MSHGVTQQALPGRRHADPEPSPVIAKIPDDPRPQPAQEYAVADSYDQIEAAWALVYESYRNHGLIDPNAQRLHTLPQATQSLSTVILGLNDDDVVTSTVSAYFDDESGLPLDEVYGRELDRMRHSGRQLVEVGLFAYRGAAVQQSLTGLLELMRHVWYFGRTHGADDLVIGVHPHHARFYQGLFRFEPFAEQRSYPTVRNHPVVPLVLDLAGKTQLDPLPKGLRYFENNRMQRKAFEGRFRFTQTVLASSDIGARLGYDQRDVPKPILAVHRFNYDVSLAG